MGRPDALDRVAALLVGLAALVSIANGAAMLWSPLRWYLTVPGVVLTGPANTHFIRDIGVAYAVSGAVLLYAALDLRQRWLAALAGVAWLVGHAGVHIFELATGICAPGQFWRDAPAVLGVPALVLAGLTLVTARARISPQGLPAFVAIPAIERAAREPDNYVREIARAPGGAFGKFLGFMNAAAHRHAASATLFHAARLGSMLQEDCGGCALAAARLAVSDGVPRDEVNEWLGGRVNGEAALAFAFGEAIARASAEAGPLGDEIESRHGHAVRFELAMGAALVRGFSGTRRGLGHAQSCAATRLHV